jgi:glycerophosphoryl diester phosphodiesterase
MSDFKLPSRREALLAGADALELDLRLTRDGVLVAAHDPDAAACTDAPR